MRSDYVQVSVIRSDYVQVSVSLSLSCVVLCISPVKEKEICNCYSESC
jgi:hypothetical protein